MIVLLNKNSKRLYRVVSPIWARRPDILKIDNGGIQKVRSLKFGDF